MRIYNIISVLILALGATSCMPKKLNEDNIAPARVIYNSGRELLEQGRYKKAAQEFEKVYFQHPGSNVTPYAEIMEAYSLYLAGKYEDASDVLENFIRLHPMHPDISYAYYLRGLCEYMQINRAELDQSASEKAKSIFNEVITRFPNTKYALDASLKIDLVYDHLAGSEMDVGRYYLAQNNPVSAIPRFQKVIKEYETTSHLPEALYRMVESYLMLSLKDEAKKYGSVLGHNYNESKWYKKAYRLLSSN